MIRIHKLSHHYAGKQVLVDINLDIPAGELIAVMGPNGAGKSTLLSAIAGLILPNEGYVEVNGKRRRASVEDEMAIRQQMAYLPANPWMLRHIKVRDWLYQYGNLYGVGHTRLTQHIESLIELFHLTEQADKPLQACSTGQQKKAALCGVLVTDAPILVLDEPFTGGLDPSAIRALERVIKHLADHKERTVVLASQIPDLVEAVADRVAIIHNQALAGMGTFAELREQAGCEGPLAEVFEGVTRAEESEDEIERYLQAGGGV